MNKHNFTISLSGKLFPISTYKNFSNYFGRDGSRVEPLTRQWFTNNLNKDNIVFDIGANIGIYSILFSQHTDKVYCFEPTDTYDNFLIPNLSNNNINNIKTYKLAFGQESGVKKEKIYMIWGQEPVTNNFNFTTLDDFCNENGVIPNYIKIDVDGFDLEVLKGGEKLLENNDIIVCVEINHALHTRGYKESEIFDFMLKIGYENFMTLDNENYFFRKKL